MVVQQKQEKPGSRYWAIAQGKWVGIHYGTWWEVRRVVIGCPSVYNHFTTEKEAKEWFNKQHVEKIGSKTQVETVTQANKGFSSSVTTTTTATTAPALLPSVSAADLWKASQMMYTPKKELKPITSAPKSVCVAVCIIPPEDLWPPIQKIRKLYDPAYDRWMPHINLLFPFLEEEYIEEAIEKMKKGLANIKQFSINLNQFGAFELKDRVVIHLVPKTDPDNSLTNIYNILFSAFPQCDDQKTKSKSGTFVPHLTVGQFDNRQKAKDAFKDKVKFGSFTVKEIAVVSRGASTPFSVHSTVKLAVK
eukprot:c12305_g1_i1.p1 GENE.c12305_g1_i1~~c12305_g1_i1.p1  ORF type:complete len:305 (+),score=89.84 c12305_g1_i1:50-964(+)